MRGGRSGSDKHVCRVVLVLEKKVYKLLVQYLKAAKNGMSPQVWLVLWVGAVGGDSRATTRARPFLVA